MLRAVKRIRRVIERVRCRRLLAKGEAAMQRFPQGLEKARPSNLDKPLIVSLTSYHARFNTLPPTIMSLLSQSIRADRTILWLGEKDAAIAPDALVALKAHGLEIRVCRDVRSFTKLVHALDAFPDAYIVTADDDIYYPPDWLEKLVDRVDPRKPHILCHRAHMAIFDAHGIAIPYADWGFETRALRATKPGTALFPTGVGGVLYPPQALDLRATDSEAYLSLTPHADDVWFFWMEMLRGTKVERIPGRIPLVTWPGSQEAGLLHSNWLGGGNDGQIRALEAAYGQFDWRKVLFGRAETPR